MGDTTTTTSRDALFRCEWIGYEAPYAPSREETLIKKEVQGENDVQFLLNAIVMGWSLKEVRTAGKEQNCISGSFVKWLSDDQLEKSKVDLAKKPMTTKPQIAGFLLEIEHEQNCFGCTK